ncbi:MAG: LysM peptidoglycan-binding domain-containing protein [Kineosporiaceae bacterium]
MARPTMLPFRRARARRAAGGAAASTGSGRGLRRLARFPVATLPVAALPVGAPVAFPAVAHAAVMSDPATYVVRPGDTLSGIALLLGTDVARLVRLNRLNDPDVLLAGTTLVVPPSAVRAPAPPTAAAVSYTVTTGDTIWDIATRTGTTVAAILAANHLAPDATIRPGQILLLPGAHLPGVPQRARPAPVAPVAVHVVQPGETVTGIAARYHLRVATVLRANKLGPDTVIRPGQKLVLPGVRTRQIMRSPVPQTHAYVVQRGDTLSGIALAQHVPLSAITALNHLRASYVIFPGQRLLLPGPAPATSPAAPARPAIRAAAAANRSLLAGRDAPPHRTVKALVTTTARRYGVDPSLALAVAAQESGFDQRQVSGANAVGVMQVIPSSGRWASALVGRPLDLLDAADNVVAGVAILAALRSRAPENIAVAAYYQGMASVRTQGMYADTRRYVADVLTLRERYR